MLFVPKSKDLAGVWWTLNIDGRYSFYLPDSTCISMGRGGGLGWRSG
jgi:hypothetical protein